MKVTDFGLSTDKELNTVKGTAMMTGCGSVLWMAPEMLLGQTYNEKSDVFSFAMCLIELVDGKLPWTDCCAPSAIPLKVSQGQVPMQQLTGLNISYPRMAELIQGCWVREPAVRPAFTDVVVELEEMQLQELVRNNSNLE